MGIRSTDTGSATYLGKLFSFFMLQFPYLQNSDDISSLHLLPILYLTLQTAPHSFNTLFAWNVFCRKAIYHKITDANLNRHFTDEDFQMASKCMNRCSTSKFNREMLIKTTMRYHYISTTVAKIKRTDNKLAIQWRIGTLYCWYECQLVQSLWKV